MSMQELVRQLLTELGEDPSREGLLDTPKRVEKALRFLTSGYTADVDTVAAQIWAVLRARLSATPVRSVASPA